jgi:hypothetical protein
MPLLSCLAGLLGWAYRLRYRLRYARLGRKNPVREREGRNGDEKMVHR